MVKPSVASLKIRVKFYRWLHPQHSSQVAQLIVNIASCHYGMRDFLTQESPVTQTQPVGRSPHRGLGHPEFMRSISRRRPIRFVRERLL
jgi:hypothetical protein